jgi:hypothetical protein
MRKPLGRTALVRRATDGVTYRLVDPSTELCLTVWHAVVLTAGITCKERSGMLFLSSSLQQAKAKDARKRGGEAMNGHLKW